MEEMKKEIQSLKIKTLIMSVVIISFLISYFFAMAQQAKDYAIIRDYYQSSQELNQEMNSRLEDMNPKLEEILSNLQ